MSTRKLRRDFKKLANAAGYTIVESGVDGRNHTRMVVSDGVDVVTVSMACTPSCARISNLKVLGAIRNKFKKLRQEAE